MFILGCLYIVGSWLFRVYPSLTRMFLRRGLSVGILSRITPSIPGCRASTYVCNEFQGFATEVKMIQVSSKRTFSVSVFVLS